MALPGRWREPLGLHMSMRRSVPLVQFMPVANGLIVGTQGTLVL